MSRQTRYLRNITHVPEIIPDLGDIISGYTGGECDAATQSGENCWSEEHEHCGQYCLSNVRAWLKPKFMALFGKMLTNDKDVPVLKRYDNTTRQTDTLRFPPNDTFYITYLSIEIDHPLYENYKITIEVDHAGLNNQKYSRTIYVGSDDDDYTPFTDPQLRQYENEIKQLDTQTDTGRKHFGVETHLNKLVFAYNNRQQWKTFQEKIESAYNALENILYYQNENPTKLKYTFTLRTYYEEEDEKDKVEPFYQAMNYLCDTPTQEIFLNCSAHTFYNTPSEINQDEINQQYQYSLPGVFEFGELKFDRNEDHSPYSIDFTTSSSIEYDEK